MYEILELLSAFVLNIIQSGHYAGIFVLMALESAAIPIPSEIIMPFSGFLVSRGVLNFWQVVFWGAFGNLVGSMILYFIGFYGGRRFAIKYGKYILFNIKELERTEFYFKKYGSRITFWTRVFPVLRTYISFPAGLAKMDFKRFTFYTFFGSFLWCVFLTSLGLKLGENWNTLEVYFRKLDIVILILLASGLGYFVRQKLVVYKN